MRDRFLMQIPPGYITWGSIAALAVFGLLCIPVYILSSESCSCKTTSCGEKNSCGQLCSCASGLTCYLGNCTTEIFLAFGQGTNTFPVLYTSADAENWTLNESFEAPITAESPVDADYIRITTGATSAGLILVVLPDSIYRSGDFGQTWSVLLLFSAFPGGGGGGSGSGGGAGGSGSGTGSYQGQCIRYDVGTQNWILGTNLGIFSSADGGNTWTMSTTTAVQNTSILCMESDQTSTVAIILEKDYSLWFSTDGGNSWNQQSLDFGSSITTGSLLYYSTKLTTWFVGCSTTSTVAYTISLPLEATQTWNLITATLAPLAGVHFICYDDAAASLVLGGPIAGQVYPNGEGGKGGTGSGSGNQGTANILRSDTGDKSFSTASFSASDSTTDSLGTSAAFSSSLGKIVVGVWGSTGIIYSADANIWTPASIPDLSLITKVMCVSLVSSASS